MRTERSQNGKLLSHQGYSFTVLIKYSTFEPKGSYSTSQNVAKIGNDVAV